GKVRPLAPESVLELSKIERWDAASDTVVLVRQVRGGGERAAFRKRADRWHEIESPPTASGLPELKLEEGLNQPPRIVLVDPGSGAVRELLNLNPQLVGLELGCQEEIAWRAANGSEVRGGLYYPTGYERGKRYPLVIQTHGYKRDMFAADG